MSELDEVLLKIAPSEPHRCQPPGLRFREAGPLTARDVTMAAGYEPDLATYEGYGPGSLWRCHCGQYWIVKGKFWRKISAWRARRILKKANRNRSNTDG